MPSAAFAYPAKSTEAFRNISEVAEELDVPQHVLRFWESRFSQIRPVKRAGGRRYYRPQDVDLLKGIQALLYGEGFTIKGVQKVLKDRGVRHVAELGRNGGPPPAAQTEPVVIEKVIYVEKAAPKKRPSHLRSILVQEMTLPFLDPPHDELVQVPEPPYEPDGVAFLDSAPVAEASDAASGASDAERARLEEMLGELLGLKARLLAARRGGE